MARRESAGPPSPRHETSDLARVPELVAWRHDRGQLGELPVEAVDPVCGMTAAVGADTPTAEHDDTTYWFCCPGCRDRFAGDPVRFLASA